MRCENLPACPESNAARLHCAWLARITNRPSRRSLDAANHRTGSAWNPCTAKTTAGCFDEIESLISELHPYETPELIATPIDRASSAYGAWIEEQTSGE